MALIPIQPVVGRGGLVAIVLCSVALFIAPSFLTGAAEFESTPETAPPASSATPSVDAAKPATSLAAGAQGRIDGYLASGRWREGSKLVDIVGQFKVSGDRAAFYPADGKSRFLCLENLNSERVLRIVTESPEALDWIVQGTITEFRGENYLMISQAVIRTRAVRGPRPPVEPTPTTGDFDRPTPQGKITGN